MTPDWLFPTKDVSIIPPYELPSYRVFIPCIRIIENALPQSLVTGGVKDIMQDTYDISHWTIENYLVAADVMSHINRAVSWTSMFFDGLESFGVHIIFGVSTISANVSDLSCDSPRRNHNYSLPVPRHILIIPNPRASTLRATFWLFHEWPPESICSSP